MKRRVIGLLAGLLLLAGQAFAAAPVTTTVNAQTESAGAATCNWAISNYCRVTTAGGALTTLTLSNPVDGANYILEIDQDATGRAVTTPASIVSQGGGTGPAFSSTASGTEIWLLEYSANNTAYTVVSQIRNAAVEAHIPNTGAYGNSTNFPTGSIALQVKATNAGHFTQLVCTNQSLNGGSCTTAPTVNVFDGATNTGTALTCSTTAQSTRGTASVQAETQAFAAGDIIGIYISTQGGTCLAPTFGVDATVTYP